MIKPTQGLSAVPLFLAVAAVLAASASFRLAAEKSSSQDPQEPAPASARDEGPAEESSRSGATTYVRVEGPGRTLAPAGDPSGNDVASSIALCPSGTRVVSGGYRTITGGGETFYSDALTGGRVGWAVGAVNKLAASGTVQAVAYCAHSGTSAAAKGRLLARQRAAARREMEALVTRYRSLRRAQL
jgi:hypothetical protein